MFPSVELCQSALWNGFIFITQIYTSTYKRVRRSAAFSGRRGNLNTFNPTSTWKSPENLGFTYKNTTAFFFGVCLLFVDVVDRAQKSATPSQSLRLCRNFSSSWGVQLRSHVDSGLWRSSSRTASILLHRNLSPFELTLALLSPAPPKISMENINIVLQGRGKEGDSLTRLAERQGSVDVCNAQSISLQYLRAPGRYRRCLW